MLLSDHRRQEVVLKYLWTSLLLLCRWQSSFTVLSTKFSCSSGPWRILYDWDKFLIIEALRHWDIVTLRCSVINGIVFYLVDSWIWPLVTKEVCFPRVWLFVKIIHNPHKFVGRMKTWFVKCELIKLRQGVYEKNELKKKELKKREIELLRFSQRLKKS